MFEALGEKLNFSVEGKTAVVTGATSGLGRRFAQILVEAGANVVMVGRRRDRLNELASQLPAGRALPYSCDIAVAKDRDSVLEAAVGNFGQVEILVNCAGIGSASPATEETEEELERLLRVNAIGYFALARRAARSMIDSKTAGSIINISSPAGEFGTAQIPLAAYGASKGAVNAMTRHMATQWAAHGIRVNAISPGWFPSEANQHAFENANFATSVCSRIPMGRLGRRCELDGVLIFLASEASSYLTGQNITVDGGWSFSI
jgi:NAD(P)-dependent dehydrogenase (short-subunit alcohol dehydrogenase family)